MTERGLGAPVVWPCADNKLTGLEATLLLRKAHSEVAALVCNGDMVATEACLATSGPDAEPLHVSHRVRRYRRRRRR
jgi:LacI family transcriptional regulator